MTCTRRHAHGVHCPDCAAESRRRGGWATGDAKDERMLARREQAREEMRLAMAGTRERDRSWT